MSDLPTLLDRIEAWRIALVMWREEKRIANESGFPLSMASQTALVRLDAIAKELTGSDHNDAVLDNFLLMRDYIKQADEELKKLRPMKRDYDHTKDKNHSKRAC